MTATDTSPSTWVVTEERGAAFAGRDGREIHGEAIAAALGAVPRLLRVPKPPLFSPLRAWRNLPLLPVDDPDLILAIGRCGVRLGKHIRARSGGHSFLAVLQKPSMLFPAADFMWAPQHDRLRAANSFSTLFSPHPFTADGLREAAARLAPRLVALPSPRVGVLVGGPNRAYPFADDDMENLCAALQCLARQGASLLVATSQRTGEARYRRLQACLADLPSLLWDRRERGFYPGLLGSADVFLATPDSVNMIGEAASTGKGILLAPLRGGSRRFRRFHAETARRGVTRSLGAALEIWNYPPINATEEIADALRAALAAHRRERSRHG